MVLFESSDEIVSSMSDPDEVRLPQFQVKNIIARKSSIKRKRNTIESNETDPESESQPNKVLSISALRQHDNILSSM